MGETSNFSALSGKLDVYLAPLAEAVPVVNATPAGNWVRLAATTGDQKPKYGGKLSYFNDNDHQGPVLALRPTETFGITFTLVGLTLENFGRVLSAVTKVVSAAGPPATKKLPNKRGRIPTEYAMLLRGSALSPYGILPGQFVIPRGVFDGEPEETFGVDKRVELACEFQALEDDAQAEADRLGWLIVQTA